MAATEIIGGMLVHDPYRWLEQDADHAVACWQKAADALTVDEFNRSPRAGRVGAAVRAVFEDLFTLSAPERFGPYWFRKMQPAGRAHVLLNVALTPREKGRVLFDPAADGENASLTMCYPSPDGALVLIGVDVDGKGIFRILRTHDGQVVRTLDSVTHACICAWMPGGEGFYFQHIEMTQNAGGEPVSDLQIWWQPVIGEARREDVELDHPFAWPVVSSDGKWVAIVADQTASRPRWIRQAEGEWLRFPPEPAGMYKGAFVGDDFWAITDDISGWCRLIRIPLATMQDRSTWQEILPAKEEVKLLTLTRCGSYVALAVIEEGIMRLRSLHMDGGEVGYVPLPGKGAFGLFGEGHIAGFATSIVGPDGDCCTFVHSSLDRGCGAYRANLATLELEELETPAHVLANREILHGIIGGPQGPVPYWIMRSSSTPLDGTSPAIFTGYGGFNVPSIPHYSSMAAAWTELGGVWIHVQLRGGGERDMEFWRAGRMHRKQGTFDDFYAVLEALHDRGFTSPARTGIWGTSNGGLLVGAAVTQRPDLMRAAVAQVPLLDLLRICKDPLTLNIARADYGDPGDPADAAVMHAYSPYHNVRPGISYPALLCDAAAHDVICPPWHSRKFVAAIGAATVSGHRVRLRVRKSAGHNQMTSELFIKRDIEELTFLIEELSADQNTVRKKRELTTKTNSVAVL